MSELVLAVEQLALALYLFSPWWVGTLVFLAFFAILCWFHTYRSGQKFYYLLRWIGALWVTYMGFRYAVSIPAPLFALAVFPFALEIHGIRVFRPVWRRIAFYSRRFLHRAGMRDHVNPLWNQAFDDAGDDYVKPDDPIDGVWKKVE